MLLLLMWHLIRSSVCAVLAVFTTLLARVVLKETLVPLDLLGAVLSLPFFLP